MIYSLGHFEDWHLLTWLLSSSLLLIMIFGRNYCGDSQFSWWSRSMAIEHKYVEGERKNMMILITLMINNYWLSLSWIDVDGTRGDYQQINGNRCATDWYPTHWSPRIDTPQVHTDKHAKSVEIIAQAHFRAQMIELNSIDSIQLNRSIPASVPPALICLV